MPHVVKIITLCYDAGAKEVGGRMIVGSRLKYWREARHMTQEELAKACGLDRSHISLLENDKVKDPGHSTVRVLAQNLSVSEEELTGEAPTQHESPLELLAKLEMITPMAIPIIAEGSAGEDDGFLEYAYWAKPKAAGRNIIGIRVDGDCLTPTIFPGDTVFIDKDLSPQDGNIILCLVDGKLLLKKYREADGQHWIENRYRKINFEECQVFGVVIERSERLR